MDKILEMMGIDWASCYFLVFFAAFVGIGLQLRKELMNSGFTPVKPEEKHGTARCPSCSANITNQVVDNSNIVKNLNLFGKVKKVTCECLAVSEWDTAGIPICLNWRHPTADELNRIEERWRRHERDRIAQELKITKEKCQIARRRNNNY